MGYWSIIVPEDGKNYIKNPSFETDTTGYANFADGTATGSRTRTTDWQKRGIYSWKIEKTGGTGRFGFSYAVAAADLADFAVGDSIALSIDLNVVLNSVRLQISYNDGSAKNKTLDITTSGRHSVVSDPLTGALASLTIFILAPPASSASNATFYADGLQVERKSYSTSYCDGDQDGCQWMAQAHNSKSVRLVDEALGGREYNLDDLGYFVTGASGIGMPPIEIISQLQTLLPGSFLKDYRVAARTIELVSVNNPTSQNDLHSKRKVLLDYLRPDRTGRYKPLLLKYTGANSSTPIYTEVVYDAGLGYQSPPTGFAENTNLRLIANEPFWREDGNTAYTLNTLKTLTAEVNIAGKEEGVWAKLSTDLTGATTQVNVIKRNPVDGLIYFGGVFDSAGGVANTKNIARWNPETNAFTALAGGVGAATGAVEDLVFDAVGNVYACGQFTGMGGVALTQFLAKFTLSTSTWSSITAAGVANALIQGMAISKDGNLVVTGGFTSINGAAINRIASWNGTTWSGFGTGLAGGQGNCVAFSPGNVMYVGGVFTSANGVTVNRICYWDGSTFVAMGISLGAVGLDNTVNRLLFSSEGILYITGAFQTSNAGRLLNRICYYSGNEFLRLGNDTVSANIGLNSTGVCLAEDKNGSIWVGGNFTTAGGKSNVQYIAIWNKQTWEHADILLNGQCRAICLIDNENLYVGHDGTSAVTCSELTTVTYSGSRQAYPVIQIKRSGGTSARVRWIENLTNESLLWLNHSLQDGETLEIDLTPGNRSLESSVYGSVWKSMSQASNVSDFCLQPGENRLKVFIETAGSPTITAYLLTEYVYWSADGVAA